MPEPRKDPELVLLEDASPQEREVLERIRSQRERLYGRRLAREQALALKAQGDAHDAMAHGSLVERAISFGRAHPMVCIGAVGIGLLVGPRKLIRMATLAMPLVMKIAAKRM